MATKVIAWNNGTGNITADYDGSGNGSIVITSDSNNLYESRSQQIIVKTTDESKSVALTINQAAKVRVDLSNAVVTAANQTYNGSAKTPTPTVTLNGSTVPSTGYDVSYSDNINAGTATITITGKGDYTGTASGTFTINKATPTYTAPTRRTGLTYNGSSQYLTTSGSTSHGTIYYSTDGSNWYTSRRTGTNAGTYYCYWKLVGDSNHSDVSSTYLGTTTIAKASRSISFTTYISSAAIGASFSVAASASAGSGTVSFSTSNSSRASISGSTVTCLSSGTCTITATVAADTNYKSASTSYTLTVQNYVDLGLPSGRLWAEGYLCKNGSSYYIGGPTDMGSYFSWGNIDGHNGGETYNWGEYILDPAGDYSNTPGYSLSGDISPTDASHDAAYARLGSPWHLPTQADWFELYDNTDMVKTSVNGVSGWKFMKKSNHDIYIFFRLTGNGWKDGISDVGTRCGIWTSKYNSAETAYDGFINTSQVYRNDSTTKSRGYNIRAVR